MIHKRTLLINRKDCWVRSASDMDHRHKGSEVSLDYKEKDNHNLENSHNLSDVAFVESKNNLMASKMVKLRFLMEGVKS